MTGALTSLTISSHASRSILIPKSNSNSKPKNPIFQANASSDIEIRVCTNRTCRKQGSMETLQTLSGIAPPNVFVKSCGCLGRCGAGPNIVLLPNGVFVGHCGTPDRGADAMSFVCGGDSASWRRSLEALALRKQAEHEFSKGNFSQAEVLLSRATDLKPIGGIHIIYKDRSAARLAMGNIAEALGDAKEAETLAPKDHEAFICQGDVFMAMDHFDAAEKCYSVALELDPSIRRSKSFKGRIAKLEEKLTPANSS